MMKITKSQLLTYFKPQFLGLYIITLVVLSTAWSSVKAIQKNYRLQIQSTQLQTEVEIAEQENINQQLAIEFMKTDTYIQQQAKILLGKSLPGEKLAIVEKEVALRMVPELPQPEPKASIADSQIVQNWRDWLKFFSNQ